MAQSEKRAPLASSLSRTTKRVAGRTPAARTPANIRTMGVSLDSELRAYVRDRLGRKLGKFAPTVERVTVRMIDLNGPRGGVDKECRIKVTLSHQQSVLVSEVDADERAAFDRAVDRAQRSVQRTIKKDLSAGRRHAR